MKVLPMFTKFGLIEYGGLTTLNVFCTLIGPSVNLSTEPCTLPGFDRVPRVPSARGPRFYLFFSVHCEDLLGQ